MARDFKRSPVRVVIVDDHRLFVDALALLLGHDDRLDVIGTAGDGPSAIDLVVGRAYAGGRRPRDRTAPACA